MLILIAPRRAMMLEHLPFRKMHATLVAAGQRLLTLLEYFHPRMIILVHKVFLNPNDISGDVLLFGKIWICIAYLLGPLSWSVAICDDFIVLPSDSLDVMPFKIMTGDIVGVAWLYICMFTHESEIDSVCLLGELVGVSILLIKLILGLLILILFIIAPNRHLHPFSMPPILFL